MTNYKKHSARELRDLANSNEPTPVNLILDQAAVDFLLGLNTNNRTLSQRVVDSLVASIAGIGWKTTETLCVTVDGQLGNGQHRLTALKQLGHRYMLRRLGNGMFVDAHAGLRHRTGLAERVRRRQSQQKMLQR